MRVSVNLTRFFADHRAHAFILINQEMKRIKDVEKRISLIFNIENFFLVQEDHYLPSIEESGVIQSNSTLWVVPRDNTGPSDHQEGKESITVEERKKKKKNKGVPSTNECIESEVPKKKKKRKFESGDDETSRKKKKTTENNSEFEKVVDYNGSDCVTRKTEKKKKKMRKPRETEKMPASRTEDPEESSQTGSTDDFPRVKTIVKSFEKQTVNLMWDKEKILKRPINIVKTIIVSGGKFQESQDIPMINQEQLSRANSADATNSSISLNTVDKSDRNQSVNSTTPLDSTDKNVSNTANSTSSNSTNKSDTDASSTLTVRRRRHRKRPRKHKDNVLPNSTLPEPITQNGTVLPKFEQPNGVHIRFENEEIVEENNSALHEAPEVNSNTKEPEVNVNCVNGLNGENIVTEQTPNGQVENKKLDKISEEFILKQPALKDVSPNIGDEIAFKILRITESYSPEVSSFIVGKVMEFNPGTKEVSFCVTQGLDQCLPPQGKFSVCEDNEVLPEDTTHQFNWNTLIEPRLLSFC